MDAISLGNGNYGISIKQTESYTGRFYDFGGTINQGSLLLYNSNLFNGMALNSFKSDLAGLKNFKYGEGLYISKEENFADLEALGCE